MGWSVIDYVCGVKTKKKAAAAKHVYKLVYKSKTAQEKKLTNETRDFEPMQSAALPCVQW